ncbi:hypothetical protein QUF58_02420 [Anaerolineales bacterium HSG24]|nr:hypothetical protein [Anaerolineales bacterium HSG24]
MTLQQVSYEKLIIESIRGLPKEALIEIANFVYFTRKRIKQPHLFEEEIRQNLGLKLQDFKPDKKEQLAYEVKLPDKPPHIMSPRLTHREQAVDFKKEMTIVEEFTDG